MNINVAVVEDDARTGAGLAALLNGTPGFACVSVHTTAEDALEKIPGVKPDVVLVDLQLPAMQGVECIRRLRDAQPQLPVVVLTNFDDPDLIFGSLKAGANAYLLKRTPPAQLLEALQMVRQGGSTMTPSVARKVFEFFRSLPQPPPATEKLSDRERQVLELAKRGRRYKQVATDLGISYDAVRTHFRNIYLKLQVHSRGEAVAKHFKL
jgi:DNA-binding NarL/FixJ family response regulator